MPGKRVQSHTESYVTGVGLLSALNAKLSQLSIGKEVSLSYLSKELGVPASDVHRLLMYVSEAQTISPIIGLNLNDRADRYVVTIADFPNAFYRGLSQEDHKEARLLRKLVLAQALQKGESRNFVPLDPEDQVLAKQMSEYVETSEMHGQTLAQLTGLGVERELQYEDQYRRFRDTWDELLSDAKINRKK